MADTQDADTGNELQRQLREADEAQAEADAAMQRAARERSEAEEAQRQVLEAQAARRKAWAQNIVDTYDADLTAAESAIREQSERFADLAASDLPAALAAYMAWSEASIRHYALQLRVATVAPEVGFEATAGEQLSPPPFSEALDAAITLHVDAASDRIRDEMAAQMA
jgi:hypothetical protein